MPLWSTPRSAALCLALAAGAAHAQDGVAACRAQADDAARLACYDRLHGREAAVAPPAAAPAAPPPAPEATSRLARRWDLGGVSVADRFVPRAYKPVYALPATWSDRVNRQPTSPAPEHTSDEPLALRSVEAKYQLSLKALLGRGLFGSPVDLWGGYTQSSRWQVYNGAVSRPFRETNYEPELMLVAPLQGNIAGWALQYGGLALNHQSNGRSLPLSRSWNRIIASIAAERGEWIAEFRPWLRLAERSGDDDNPDIEDYIGRAELNFGRYWGEHALNLQARHSLRWGERSRGSLQLEWVFPLTGALHGYLQWFGGYGESMVDYNQRQNKIGLGVTIAGWR